MRHRIFIDRIEPVAVVTGDEFHHSVRVVRLRAGEEVEVFDRDGNAARGIVQALEKDRAVITVGEALPSRESPLVLHLAMSIIQLEKFELVLQKATELGVRSIVPLVTDRIELRAERYAGKMDRWNKIVFEAVKQSGRTRVPLLHEPVKVSKALESAGAKIFFDADIEPTTLATLEEATLFIGPEGGWSDAELQLARDRECFFQRLGPRRLRAETAAIVAASVISSRFGDL
ncbi:MAG TPA: RsmE family RNA methyltransferase [Thermoanaerobaculia bacterium]|jgi:16S rRNA (uracil1498-N3)-methyltransferase